MKVTPIKELIEQHNNEILKLEAVLKVFPDAQVTKSRSFCFKRS